MAATKLTPEHKAFLVRCFARYLSAGQAIAALSEWHGVQISKPSALRYNPDSPIGRDLPAQLVQLFEWERGQYMRDVEAVPLSHQAVRLHELQTLFSEAKHYGNALLAAKLLEQAAREMGDWYVNHRAAEVRDRAEARRAADRGAVVTARLDRARAAGGQVAGDAA